MLFWIIAAGLSASVAGLIGLTALRAPSRVAGPGGADIPVYRAQLAEVARDQARGVIGADEAGRLSNEIARRLLAADAAAQTGAESVTRRLSPGLVALLALLVVGGALALYTRLGAPGYGDLPLADRLAMAAELRDTRPSQAEVEASLPPKSPVEVAEEFQTLMTRLRDAVATRPGDLQGHRLLARNEASLGNFRAAYAAQEQVLMILGTTATAQDYLDYGEYMIYAAGGYVSPKAESALRAVLSRDAENGTAQYYLGAMWRQTGRPDLAFRIWDRLLRTGPENASWIAPIRAQIDEAAMLAGVTYEPPRPNESLAGPSAADIDAAGEMDVTERQDMIRGMVTRLAERLATQGGSAAEWARLIGAYGVLGETARARTIRDEARQVFAGRSADLATIDAAAAEAGLNE
ncbi:c-type cytochrome biogenesis protein CcmI [Pseudooceanicola sp.]|uniref:c-type cytochrome biogenesis protein CcmI n=1 Tax=Pseudooceanicola sp. TaxID=1914328 RepID=UPI00261DD2F1|nr:c-type cytochrome biogenesis protein CcmI [Pseudooceanicola sp.]MDF1856084.1 c-type cytochrome biogenesis protein CcmI [Pseudooceanicola sp.]